MSTFINIYKKCFWKLSKPGILFVTFLLTFKPGYNWGGFYFLQVFNKDQFVGGPLLAMVSAVFLFVLDTNLPNKLKVSKVSLALNVLSAIGLVLAQYMFLTSFDGLFPQQGESLLSYITLSLFAVALGHFMVFRIMWISVYLVLFFYSSYLEAQGFINKKETAAQS